MNKKRKRKLNKFALGGALIGGALFISVNFVSSYDQQNTHPALTDEAVDFYNLNFPTNLLSNEDKRLLIKGAIEEDTPPRWLNHFYDPIYNIGWIGYTTSKKWAISSGTQQAFTDSAYNYGGFANLFSDGLSPTDFSYERALHDYASGNRERAMLAMGHVMHLLEDSNVPEHTRGDTHLPWHGTESPYEKTMAKWNPDNINIASELFKKSKKPVLLNQIGSYFDEIAGYSNKYFFSEDTIDSEKYNQPKITKIQTFEFDGKFLKFAIGKDKNLQDLKLALLNTRTSRNIVEIKDATLVDPSIGTLILDDYWSRLSTDFVMHGAGALKLFLDQAEKIKQEYATNDQFRRQDSGMVGQFLVFLGFSGSGSGPVIFNPDLIESIISQPMVLGDSTNDVSNDDNDVSNSINDVTIITTPLSLSVTSSQTPLTPSPLPSVLPGQSPSQPFNDYYGPISGSGGGSSVVTINDITPSPSSSSVSTPTPMPTPAPSEEATLLPSPTPAPVPTEEATPLPTPTPTPVVTRRVIINEIAWMGTEKSSNDEWLELFNTTSRSIDLTDWTLKSLTNTASSSQPDPLITFVNKIIDPFGFFLLERTDDNPVSDIGADQIYNGGLDNIGETLELRDGKGDLQDVVSSSQDGWYAGINEKISNVWQRFSMERIDPLKPGNDATNWATNNGLIGNGQDAGGNPINGTPKAQNSVYNANQNITPSPTPTPTTTPTPSPGIVWQFEVPDANYIGQSAVANDGTVYFGAPNNTTGEFMLYAIGSDGVEKWHFEDTGMPTIPAVSDYGTVYFGHLSGPGVYALNPDGTIKWLYDTSRVNGVSVDDDGNVYATSNNKMINKIGPDGSEAWRVHNPFAFGFTPVSVDDSDRDVYLVTDSAGLPEFYRLGSSDGSVIWQNRVSDGHQYQAFDPVFDKVSDKFYTTTTAGHVVSVNHSDGEISSHLFAFGVPTTSKIVIFEDILVFGVDFTLQNPASGQAVVALNKSDKSKIWTFPVDSRVISQVAVDPGSNFYFATRSGKVYSLDKNGQKRWEVDLGVIVDTYPVFADNAVFVGADGKLFKIGN
ncbi:MAG: PQQ-binding-like beta-propeller repeat protein [Candidatus Yanofskybacteria bacterium]|nr:PQQ-binding-like beta-propeller repeat protein [Candidatus Yanofskybacteria bacterium]